MEPKPETPTQVGPDTALARRVMAARGAALGDDIARAIALQQKDGRVTDAATAVARVFDGRTWDPLAPLPIAELRDALAPHLANHHLFQINAALADFVDDFRIVELLERDGLEAMNGWLASRIFALRTRTHRYEALRAELADLDDVLYRMLFVCPLALGVEVALTIGAYDRTEQMRAKYGWLEHRVEYIRFHDRWQEERGTSFGNRFVVEMPYGFTTGAHGSGERSARAQSYESAKFTELHVQGKPGRVAAAFGFTCQRPVMVWHRAPFALDELVSLRVIEPPADGYSPWTDGKFREEHIEARATPALHYLLFRNFTRSGPRREELARRFPDITDAEVGAMFWRLLMPSQLDRGLCTLEWDHPHWRPARMFIADPGPQWVAEPHVGVEAEATVYEIPALPPGHTPESVFLGILRGDPPCTVIPHRGRDAIIRRLAEIPVAPRNF